jgi:hypothetical protein
VRRELPSLAWGLHSMEVEVETGELLRRISEESKMRTLKILGTVALLSACLMLVAPGAHAQRVAIGVGIGAPGYIGPAPVCRWGYYGYYPYACAPYGYYGPSWFSGGIFIGAGPWFHGGGFYGRPGFYGGRPGFYSRPGFVARGPVGGFRGGVAVRGGVAGGGFRGGAAVRGGGSFAHGGGHGGGHR